MLTASPQGMININHYTPIYVHRISFWDIKTTFRKDDKLQVEITNRKLGFLKFKAKKFPLQVKKTRKKLLRINQARGKKTYI